MSSEGSAAEARKEVFRESIDSEGKMRKDIADMTGHLEELLHTSDENDPVVDKIVKENKRNSKLKKGHGSASNTSTSATKQLTAEVFAKQQKEMRREKNGNKVSTTELAQLMAEEQNPATS
mmetsp:Transcript_88194/g.176376  ORF Transcript_88194/g.176376 Transcript_88194/m.176376 type:complete len:121 (-) Transcript_88194:293-655(-)|eukprot:CAMPEP_0171611036 /NCGR_PEP_ID=MMETSP0990-20121206/10391_1 /TAXON_ID=483369 /ORGANISM="non described non described, Strain CCMP2098" /LENGTH=120 /DNA_ID=CAMNT_0012174531 /DNA_START=94 /DNA_END=456 /DNA_ORIENTATION=+